ncbi:MAG: PAS domain S-box protein, partial [Gallionellaceae bacterium]
MPPARPPNSAARTARLAAWIASLVVLVGSMVLLGWAYDIPVPKSVLPGWVSMNPSTAACFIMIGVALRLLARPSGAFGQRRTIFFSAIARFFVLLVALVAVLTLGEYVLGWSPGIDHWLVSGVLGTVGTPHPGRMAPDAALGFILLAVALWINGGARKTRRGMLASVSIGLLVIIFTLAALATYAMLGSGAYSWFGSNNMAASSAILFIMLGAAIIAIGWQPDVLSWSLNGRTTAAFACGMAVLVFIGLSNSRSQFWMEERRNQIAHDETVLRNITDLMIEITDAQAHLRSYLITGNEQFKTDYVEAANNSLAGLDTLRKLVAGTPHDQRQFDWIEQQINAQLQWMQQMVQIDRGGMSNAARNEMVARGEALRDDMHNAFDEIDVGHREFAGQLEREWKKVSFFVYLTISIGTFGGLLIFLAVIFRLNFAESERAQRERALRGSEEHFRAVAQSANDAIITGTGTGNIVGWNAAAERLFGYAETEILGQPLTQLMPERFRMPHRTGLTRVVAGGEPHVIGKTVEWAGLRKDGGEFPLEISLGQWQSAEGQFFTAIIRDITERKQAEATVLQLNAELEEKVLARTAELERARLEAERASRAKSEF